MKFCSKGILSELTKEKVIELIGEKELWSKYCDCDVQIGKKILSPLESENNPSAGFFVAKTGQLLLNDFRLGCFNIFSFLKFKHGWSVSDSLKHIDQDWHLGYFDGKKLPVMKPKEELKGITEGSSKKIWVQMKPWEDFEIEYWNQYYISIETLKILHVFPISIYWIQGKDDELYCFKKQGKELLFCFDFGEQIYKIYKPKANEFKWIFNGNSNVLMGIDSLPWLDDILIITKGLKETAILREIKLNSIGLQAETSFPDLLLIKQLKYRFKKIFYLADVDIPGLKSMEHAKNEYKWIPIVLPESTEYKDLADYSRLKGLKEVQELINKQI